MLDIEELIDVLTEAKRVYGNISIRVGLSGYDDTFTHILTAHVERNGKEPIHVWLALHR